MRVGKHFFFAIILFFVSHIVFAESAGGELSQLLNKTKSMKTSFSQIMRDKHGKILQQSSGSMALARPGKFRWDVKTPNPQLIISNNQKIWVYDPDLAQVTVRALTKEAGEAPALLLSDNQQMLETKFTISTIKNTTSAMRWFLLTPKDPNSLFVTIKVGFLHNQLHVLKLLDHLEQTTEIQFGSIEINPVLSDGLFHFTAPQGVDVIDATQRR